MPTQAHHDALDLEGAHPVNLDPDVEYLVDALRREQGWACPRS